jgi:multicomponent Na+:H+ antiporter subunit B
MNSVILQIAQRYVRFLLLFFAVVALLRGHNHPGGGFIGGLLAGLSIVMKGFAYNMEQIKSQMKFSNLGFIGTGLGLILLSSIPSMLKGKEFMTGLWVSVPLPLLGEQKFGTPLLFDVGVFFAVIGVILMFLFSLKKGS